MIRDYIDTALRHAHYEIIDNPEPYYGEIDGLQGVWATGPTLEECRDRLTEVLDTWLIFRIANGMDVSPIGDVEIIIPREAQAA